MAKQRITHKERAKRRLESLGWTVADVEKYQHFSRRRYDLFGIIDLLAVKETKTLGLQVTSSSGGNVAAHVEKMLAEPRLWDCLAANWLVEVWGVRSKPTRDGSFAVTRYFEMDKRGLVTPYDGSLILS